VIVNLSVHKNTLKQHRAKLLRNRMKADVKNMMTSDFNGYAIVTWDNKGSCNTAWSIGNTDPVAMPDKVRNAILRVQASHDKQDS